MATVETIAQICYPEIPTMFGHEELSKEFKQKFGKLYAKELAGYKSACDECSWLYGRPDTAVIAGEGALNYLQWFKERLQEEGALVLNRWLELICDSEEEGPRNFWAACTLHEIANLCLEELGVQDPWEYRHAYFAVYEFEEEPKDHWDKYAIYDALYN